MVMDPNGPRRCSFNRLVLKRISGCLPAPVQFGCEIGVWQGRLSAFLLESLPSLYLTMVDAYQPYADSRIGRSSSSVMQEAMQRAVDCTTPWDNRRKLIVMDSLAAAKQVEDLSQGFVFIDAEHAYDAVRGDLRAWWQKVKPGGLFFGHDYKIRRGFGVIRAVNEFVDEHKLKLGVDGRFEGIWWVQKHD